jgi:hypothetical protein
VVYTSGIEFLDVPPLARMAIERFLDRVGSASITAEHGEIH